LAGVVSTTGGIDHVVEAILEKARSTVRTMDKLWKSKIIGRATKEKNIFNVNVKVV